MSPSTSSRMSGIPVNRHRDAVDAQPERETRVPLGVVAEVLEDLGMHHAAAQQLDPAVPARPGSPAPSHTKHVMAIWAPGSTNGKKAGPSSNSPVAPEQLAGTAWSVPFRWANVMPSSTARPST